MKDIKIPSSLKQQLKDINIKNEDILSICPIDLSFDCEYFDGYILLTNVNLIIAMAKEYKPKTVYFKGTTNNNMDASDIFKEYSLSIYETDNIAKIHIEHQVATNLLVADINNQTVKLAAFTNLYLEKMNELVRSVKNIKAILPSVEEDAKEEKDESLYCPKCGNMYPDQQEKICPHCTNKRSIFLRMLKYFLKYKVGVIFLFITYVISALISIAWPYLSGKVLYNYVLAQNDSFLKNFGLDGKYFLALMLLVLTMIGCKLIQQGASMLQMVLCAKISAKTVRDIKLDIFSSMSRLSVNFFTSKQTGGLMTRVLSDADRVTEFFIDGLPYIFIHSMTIIVTFAVMFTLNIPLAIASCILIPLLVFMSVKLKPGLWGLFGRRHRAEKAVTSKVNDNLTGARVVKAFGKGDNEIDNFQVPNNNLMEAEINIVKYNNRFTVLYNFVQEISNIWVWILGVFLVIKTGSIELGSLITFIGYVSQLNGPMNFFSRVFHMWSDSINSAQRMFEIIDAIPDVKENEHPVSLKKSGGQITLKDVTFGYNVAKPVLKGINLTIEKGEMLGIVGRSGAGKTTLVNLISRLYDTNEGEIYIDGINVKDLSFKDLRRNVAMVSQDTYIFMGTVADNISYADENATREDIINAAVLAGAHEFISKMPDGYDTFIGAGGKGLSGGEKQRISIARAILANPKILILDEATASVDTETEKAIQKSLNYLVKGRTTLSIAHRLSTLRDADRLIVIDNGRIVEEGTSDELDALGGIYHKLLELQVKSLNLKENF